MAEIYRVAVQRVVRTLNENGAETDRDYVSVIEFEAPADALLRFAAAEVAAALGAPGVAVTVYPEPQQVPAGEANEVRETLVPTPHPSIAATAEVHARVAEREADAAPAAEAPKRTRRTKAQKAADDAAQAEGYRDAAHKSEVLAGSSLAQTVPGEGPTGDGDADLAAASLVTRMAAENDAMPTPVPVVSDPNVPNGVAVYVPADVASPLPANGPASSEPPAAPWNPFNP
jgi:hypothetical protein